MWWIAIVLNAAEVAMTWGYLELVYGGGRTDVNCTVTANGYGCSGSWY